MGKLFVDISKKHDLQNQTAQQPAQQTSQQTSQQTAQQPAQQPAQQTVGNRKEEIVCAVCYEYPMQFGLLNACDHVFCLKCVREWRNSKTKDLELRGSNVIKDCPLCRVRSDFVVPSFKFMTGQKKEKEIQAYKTKLEKIPCKYFNRRGRYYRVCPFGDSCFYAHTDEDGKKLSCTKGPPQYARNLPAPQLIQPDFEALEQELVNQHLFSSDSEDDEFYPGDGEDDENHSDSDDENHSDSDDENHSDSDDANHSDSDDEY